MINMTIHKVFQKAGQVRLMVKERSVLKYMSTADPEKQRTPEFETRRAYSVLRIKMI